MTTRVREAITLLPALAALGIAVLYAAGAIVKAGQLRAAGLSVRDALPLVPLQQLLTLGIGTLVTSMLWLVSVAFVMWLYLVKFEDWGFGEDWNLSPRALWWWNRIGIAANVLWIFWLLYWFWVLPFFSAVATSAAFSIGRYAAQTHRGRTYVATALVIYFATLVAARTGEAYVSPAPLAHADITTNHGDQVQGSLVATDGGSVYVATSQGQFQMIPASEVARLRIHSIKRKHEPRPVLKVVWQRVSSWF